MIGLIVGVPIVVHIMRDDYPNLKILRHMELTVLDKIGTYWHSVGDIGACSGLRLFTASANRSHFRGLASFAPIVAQYLAVSGFRSIDLFYSSVLLLLEMLWFDCGSYLKLLGGNWGGSLYFVCQGGLVYELSVTIHVYICGKFRTLTATVHFTANRGTILVLVIDHSSLAEHFVMINQSVLAVLPGKHNHQQLIYS